MSRPIGRAKSGDAPLHAKVSVTAAAALSTFCDLRTAQLFVPHGRKLQAVPQRCTLQLQPNGHVGSMHNRRVRTVHPGSRGGGFESALRPLTQPEHSSAAVKQKAVKKPEGRKATGSDKENAGQQKKHSSEKSLPGYLRATKSSKSKADPPEEWSHTMEDQLHSLQGDFAALKRDSVRLSLAGRENAPLGTVPQSPAHASIAARLSALKRESFQAIDNPLSAAGDTPLRELNAPRGAMPASYSTLMPTTRENLRLTAAPDQRMSMSEMDPFEAAGQWDAPSLAQVAEELFSDATFAEMCERGLTMQLKRTKDGATAETRIAELAGWQTSDLCMSIFLHLMS